MGSASDELQVHKLRMLHCFRSKTTEGRTFGVCALPTPRRELTDEEYAPYLAAAEGKHDSYMRHGAPWAAGDLAYEVTVKGTVIAWLPYDGVPRIIERDLGDAEMNRARDLARAHLGAAPETQQQLADDRGDIGRLSAEGFERIIFEHLDRAEHGSCFNDFPTDMSVREYVRREQARLRAERAATAAPTAPGAHDDRIVYVPNPTVDYSDQQRREWAAEAARCLAAFRDRFPDQYTAWMTQHHHVARLTGPLKPLELRPGDRIGAGQVGRRLVPAIVLRVEEAGGSTMADLLTEHGESRRVEMLPHNTVPQTALLPETRALWTPVWQRLTAQRPAPDDCEPES